MWDWYAGTAQFKRKYSLSSSRKLSARALSPWKVAGGDPCGLTSWFGAAGCPAPPAAGGPPPGSPPPPPGSPPPPPGDPPPPGGPPGFCPGGSYFLMAFPKACLTPSSL